MLVVAILAVLAGCNSPEQKPSTEAKPAFQPTYLTGREALQKMYIAARAWAADAKPYNLQSQPTKDAAGQDGKAGIWTAGFASPARKSVKVFTWSGVQADNAPEPGISNRPEDTYNPANTSTTIFDMAFLKIDSDEAAKTAAKHGGDKELKNDKNTSVFYVLTWNGRENKLVWRVICGEDLNNPKLAIDVDASTATFMKVER
ncbi:MAG TPA: hypothetical protein VG897_12310 [Terriglobales bacterium]|nr:hypothetical protein [Terriglobales bacterium]